MRKTLVVAAALAALAGQGCTVVGVTIGMVKASNANAERDAQVRAGAVFAEDDEPPSMAAGAIGGGLLGFLIDGMLVLGLAAAVPKIGDISSD
jgi:hypothetical protein